MEAIGCCRCDSRRCLAVVLLASSPLHAFASPLIGISPQDKKYYFDGAVIACKDGPKFFPWNRLIDGFCDCPDGTDEPGTSACPESKFYRRNTGDTPRFLFSSRLNGHICDCCDGSDEYDSDVICRNTCTKDESYLNFRVDDQDSTNIKLNDIAAQERTNNLIWRTSSRI